MAPLVLVLVVTAATLALAWRNQTRFQQADAGDSTLLLARMDLQEIQRRLDEIEQQHLHEIKRRAKDIERRLWS